MPRLSGHIFLRTGDRYIVAYIKKFRLVCQVNHIGFTISLFAGDTVVNWKQFGDNVRKLFWNFPKERQENILSKLMTEWILKYAYSIAEILDQYIVEE